MNLQLTDIDALAFDKAGGLIPVIVQHADNGAVLMLGYMNSAALRETLQRRRVVFFSRSRQRLWEKGETSGHTLDLIDLVADCDRDTLLATALPRGPVCHQGTLTCFGDDVRTRCGRLSFLADLQQIIEQRATQRSEDSYTAKLLASGPKRIAQKVGEEGLETALAALVDSDPQLIGEAADLLFHLSVLLRSRGLTLEQVVDELARRHLAAS